MAVQNGSQKAQAASADGATTKPTQSGVSLNIKKWFKRMYRLVSSHVGLVVLLFAFSFIGAGIFKAIEGPYEEGIKHDILLMREDMIKGFWNTTPGVKASERAYKTLMRRELKVYEKKLFDAFQAGIITPPDFKVWDFWGSFFYVATVYSTIGYGHIAPITDAGRIVTMLYAVLGIPLCLIVMADLGKLFTRGIKYLWAYLRRFWYSGKCKKVVNQTGPYPDQLQYPGQPQTPYSQSSYSSQHLTQQQLKERELDEPDKPYVVDDEFNLPVIVAIGVTVIYIFLGALLYTQWEEWDYLDAFYFIFISISTIGFGDVLPDHPKYFLVSSIYILVGLSLVSMVINVIMESMSTNIEKAATRITEVSKTIGISLEGIEDEEEMAQSQLQASAAAVKNK